MSFNKINKKKLLTAQLASLKASPRNTFVIHYASSGIGSMALTASPTISALAVRSLENGQTHAFSIFHSLEKMRISTPATDQQILDAEKLLLEDFSAFLAKHVGAQWIHWNMRDIDFGFAALEHRASLHSVPFPVIDDANKVNLASALVEIYGANYINHPRLPSLMTKNNMSDRGILTGEAEASSFKSREFSRIYHSTIHKVDTISNILTRSVEGDLKVANSLIDQYGGYVPFALSQMRDHWIVGLIGLVSAIAGIAGLILQK